MKYLLILLLFVSGLGYAQEDNHYFKLNEHNELIWQKTYTIKDSSNYVNSLLKREKTSNIKSEYGQILGEFNNIQLKGSKYPVYSKRPTKGSLIIEFKENRIRVTVVNIVFQSLKGNVLAKEKVIPATLSKYALNNKNEIKKGKSVTSMLQGLDEKLSLIFKPTKDDNDW